MWFYLGIITVIIVIAITIIIVIVSITVIMVVVHVIMLNVCPEWPITEIVVSSSVNQDNRLV